MMMITCLILLAAGLAFLLLAWIIEPIDETGSGAAGIVGIILIAVTLLALSEDVINILHGIVLKAAAL